MKRRTFSRRWLVGSALAALCMPASLARATPIELRVDASDVGRRLLHAYLEIPVQPGPITLVYPKWAPGEHMPNNLLNNLLGLKISAAGKTLDWRRDDVDMYQFHVETPPGGTHLEVSLDYLLVRASDRFEAGPAAAEQWLDLCWNQVLLYPLGAEAAELEFAASLHLPAGWKYATARPSAWWQSEQSAEKERPPSPHLPPHAFIHPRPPANHAALWR